MPLLCIPMAAVNFLIVCNFRCYVILWEWESVSRYFYSMATEIPSSYFEEHKEHKILLKLHSHGKKGQTFPWLSVLLGNK